MMPTIRLEREYDPAIRRVQIGKHEVIEGAFSRIQPRRGSVDVFFFDTPSVDPNCTLEEYALWLSQQFQAIEKWRSPDAALILVPTDRKGHPWSKSVSTAHAAELFGWNLFRHFVWLKQAADFNRSHYAFQDVWVYRKGNMPTQASEVKYKDVLRVPSLRDDSHVGTLPSELVSYLLPLFIRPHDSFVVMDPFAGRGSVMRACDQLGLRSVSVELHPERAADLVSLAFSLKEAS